MINWRKKLDVGVLLSIDLILDQLYAIKYIELAISYYQFVIIHKDYTYTYAIKCMAPSNCCLWAFRHTKIFAFYLIFPFGYASGLLQEKTYDTNWTYDWTYEIYD